jgi:hypothetical protein
MKRRKMIESMAGAAVEIESLRKSVLICDV